MLQFITNTESKYSVVDQILAVLEGGCKWIQIRMKEASDDEIKEVVKAVLPKAGESEAFILLDDRVELCKELNLTGVHVGKNDMPPSKARTELGPLAVIGSTANTFSDIEQVAFLDVDYVGVGPFRHTTTKKNLAPILGLDGIAGIVAQCKQAEYEIPIVAIGGITLDDVEPLLAVGVNGIAVSGAIANADDMVEATRRFIELMPTGM